LSYLKQKTSEKENEKLKSSLSCDFIDNPTIVNRNNKLISKLNEFKPMDFEGIDENKILIAKPGKTNRIKKLNLTSFNNPIKNEPIIENSNESSTIIPTSISASNMTSTYNTNEIVKTVKFKEPLEVGNCSSIDLNTKIRNKAEEQLLNALDETLLSANLRSSPSLSNSTNEDESLKADTNEKRVKYNRNILTNEQTIKPSISSNNMEKPPKPNTFSSTNSPIITTTNTTSSLTRTKFAQNKSRTIDFPDLLQGAMDSTNTSVANIANNKTSTSTSYLPSNTNTNLPPNKPIQSILRRSETPPNTKIPPSTSFRQASIESTESSKERDRESSIEKKLRMTSSTSRPLMFQ
jgi:hypothetical protein